jgi:hypothetical protein
MTNNSWKSDQDKASCPNCYDPIPGPGFITPSGVRVCDAGCASGWMRGERHLEYLKIVARLCALLKGTKPMPAVSP